MPLEALHHAITPGGLHYLVVHFDIPDINPNNWRLTVARLNAEPLRLDLDAILGRPSVTLAVTMECAGNGRAQLTPRPVSQPWFVEGVSTAEWTGTPLANLLRDAGIGKGASDIVFSGVNC
jgi:DMSO/TMAO reductase YedYZ molybdopterin-dependent catalytic subunit